MDISHQWTSLTSAHLISVDTPYQWTPHTSGHLLPVDNPYQWTTLTSGHVLPVRTSLTSGYPLHLYQWTSLISAHLLLLDLSYHRTQLIPLTSKHLYHQLTFCTSEIPFSITNRHLLPVGTSYQLTPVTYLTSACLL